MQEEKHNDIQVLNPLKSYLGRRIIQILVLLSGSITLLVTLVQLFFDYNQQFSEVDKRHHEIKTVHTKLIASSLWDLDLLELQRNMDGLIRLPHIDYLQIKSNKYKFESGKPVNGSTVSATYPLTYTDPYGMVETVGSIYVESNASAIYDTLIHNFLTTLATNMVKTVIVCYVILVIFNRSINQRIFTIVQYLRQYNPSHENKELELNNIRWITSDEDELSWLANEVNKLTHDLTTNIHGLHDTRLELEDLNKNLEKTVEERTKDLEQSLQQLKRTQNQLIESEKLAALGGLVAGVAHEVNTPLGISTTAASMVAEVITELNHAFESQTLTSTQFADLMHKMETSSALLESNLNRASKLIKDFKQTAVDQVSESRNSFNISQVLNSLLSSLHPETRKIPVHPAISGDTSLEMNSLPGVLTQVISNLVLNSVNHAFEDCKQPEVHISFYEEKENIIFIYTDNGSGIPKELHQRIFEPFFTTKRGKGGSGLGLNLVFNLIRQKLKGHLDFKSEPGQGVHYTLTIPKELNS
ncbi:sensor histidine kinase [Vibrio quintilis]|uniref:histidine kinase n=1 Tax=Vibrio quintilis TaxID=1117707 RepID=A0A1M7YTN9_9VIBR|nr:ATP-binding protein [Vibrio quintilis]SHO55965.1 Sensor protein ZraS [Vibrio quintilis]